VKVYLFIVFVVRNFWKTICL